MPSTPAASEAAGPQVVFSLERTLFQQVYRAGDGCHREWLPAGLPSSPRRLGPSRASACSTGYCWPWSAASLPTPGLQRVIANSRQVKDEIIRHYQVDPDRIALIYNGLDRHRFRPLKEPERHGPKSNAWGRRPRRPSCYLSGRDFHAKA